MTLDDLPLFVHGSATSEAAHDSIKPSSARLRSLVLAFICSRGPEGATDEECQVSLGMNPNTQRPRRIELVTKMSVRDSGRTRKTRAGRLATVWVAVGVQS